MFNELRIGKSAKSAKKFTPVHPNIAIGKSHGFSLMLFGKHSAQYRNGMAAYLRRNKKRDLSVDEQMEESAKLIVCCCDGWDGATDKGKAVAYAPEKLLEMLTDDDFRWMRLQAEKFQLSDDDFF